MLHAHSLHRDFGSFLDQLEVRHPVLEFLLVFAGLPAALLLAVALFTTAVTFPFALAFGWL